LIDAPSLSLRCIRDISPGGGELRIIASKLRNNFAMKFSQYTKTETNLFKKLDTPQKIQDFLAFKIRHNPAKDGIECRSPRRVLADGKAHCMEGALLAAAILEFHGQKPLLMDLRSTSADLDHVVCLFKKFGCWGAISKTNHAVLRYREPIYKTLHELALSYFHEYFLDSGKKTLREYSVPFDAKYLDLHPISRASWRVTDEDLIKLPDILDSVRHFDILSSEQIKNLRKADKIEIKAGKLVEWK
jgi:hypothetical protein